VWVDVLEAAFAELAAAIALNLRQVLHRSPLALNWTGRVKRPAFFGYVIKSPTPGTHPVLVQNHHAFLIKDDAHGRPIIH
jgi:hypothetical protein